MRAILIDPKAKTITEVEHNGDYRDIYKLIEAEIFQGIQVNDHNCCYIDDEGLFKPDQFYFKWGPQTHLAGRALVLGVNDEGDSVSTDLPLDRVQRDVYFYETQPVFDRVDTTSHAGDMPHGLGKGTIIEQKAKFK